MKIKQLFNEIFRNKTVFITGHTGFQGSWISLWLKSLGANVVGYSLEPPTEPSLYDIIKLETEISHITGDVCDLDHLQKSLRKHEPHFVIHLAAQSLVRLSYEKPVETFQTNVMGTVNLLESIKKIPNLKSCVIMTSDKCYENKEWVYSYRENDPMGGYDPYSASKGATELIVASFRNSFFKHNRKIGIASVRAGNVIGGGDWAKDRIVPDCIRSFSSKKSILLHNPNAIRPWQHVLEPISGILWLAAKIHDEPHVYSEPWNFGPNNSSDVTVKELVSKIIKQWGSGTWKNQSKKNRKNLHEANYLRLDSSKATNLLGWSQVYSLEEAISETILWYRNYSTNKKNMKNISLKQIQNYVQKAKQMNIIWTRS